MIKMNQTMEYNSVWSFIEKHLPNYYQRDDVLKSDILFRFINGDDVDDEDKVWIRQDYNNDINLITQDCILLEYRLFQESLEII